MSYDFPRYRGSIVNGERYVIHAATRRSLKPRLDLVNHSPSGLSWGYLGSGCAQLALAILADFTDDDEEAERLHQRFKEVLIAALPENKEWMLTNEQVKQAYLLCKEEDLSC